MTPLPAKNTTNPAPIDERLMFSVYLILFFNTAVLFADQSSATKVAVVNLTLLSFVVVHDCLLISLAKTNCKPVHKLWLGLKAWFFLTVFLVGFINIPQFLPQKVKFIMCVVAVLVSSAMFCFLVTHGVVKCWRYGQDEPEKQITSDKV